MSGQLIEAVHFEWEKLPPYSYVRNIKALQSVQEIDFSNAVTFFVRENGSGKSTLLEAMAVAHGFNPEGGTMNYRFSTHDSHSDLCDAIRLVHGHLRKMELLSACRKLLYGCHSGRAIRQIRTGRPIRTLP